MDSKTRSYQNGRTLRPGDVVEFVASTYYRRPIAVGEVAEIVSLSNAGFRGIEALVRFEDESLANVSAGIVEAL